ncbi:sigma-70 family RNA polymerase sigma factor [Halobacillus mangrovi]|uniref:sigma-70 family RNA polymerase sigma factor n=1 Tax=Halobacillus mangrovi TaxID=402384 RepID=UPI003D99FE40
MMDDQEFEKVVVENEKLIHYHIRSLHINDGNKDFFAEALFALWKAYETYDESLGSFSTYISWKIRNALIDKIRKDSRSKEIEDIYQSQVLHEKGYIIEDEINDHYLWKKIKEVLTDNQWKWVYYFIIHDLSVEQIAKLEGVTRDAVKNWGRHARKKLKQLSFEGLEKP